MSCLRGRAWLAATGCPLFARGMKPAVQGIAQSPPAWRGLLPCALQRRLNPSAGKRQTGVTSRRRTSAWTRHPDVLSSVCAPSPPPGVQTTKQLLSPVDISCQPLLSFHPLWTFWPPPPTFLQNQDENILTPYLAEW